MHVTEASRWGPRVCECVAPLRSRHAFAGSIVGRLAILSTDALSRDAAECARRGVSTLTSRFQP